MIKQIIKYTIPSIITSLLTGIYVIVDGFFVGHRIGELGLAALNVAWPVTAFIQTFGVAIGTSCGIKLSIASGSNDFSKEKTLIKNTFMILIMFSFLMLGLFLFLDPLLYALGATSETILYCKDYLNVIILTNFIQVFGCALTPIIRNFGYIKIAAFALIFATFGNAIGDYIFLYKLNLGLGGAAISSIIAQSLAMITCFIVLIKTKHYYFSLKLDFKIIKEILITSIAPFILMYSASLVIILYNLAALKYGNNQGVAAYTVLAYVIYLAQYAAQGVSDGVQPLFSFIYGQGDYKKLLKTLKLSLLFVTIFTGFLMMILLFINNQIGSLFAVSGTTKTYFNQGYYYFVNSFIFVGIIRIISCYFYAINENKYANILVILEPFILTPICLLIIPAIFKLNGVWITHLVIQIIICFISVILLILKHHKRNNVCEKID